MTMGYRKGGTLLLAMAGLLAPVERAIAQNPGPPPATATAVPTLEQARSFFESQIAAHGQSSCQKVDGNYVDQRSQNHTVSLAARILKLITTRKSVGSSLRSSDSDEERKTYTVDISTMTVAISKVSSSRFSCDKQPVALVFQCPGNCGKYKSESVYVLPNRPARGSEDEYPTSMLEIGLDDVEIAPRILKAFNFYRDNLPPAEESPF